MPPFLFGAAMRYLSVLLLSPSLVYAACAPGVNYGSLGISSPSPTCIAYSGSSLGGCTAYCGGGAGSTVCVELPLDNPPSKGPYFSDGTECKLGGTGGGDPGGGDDNGGGNGEGEGGEPGVDPIASYKSFSPSWVGRDGTADISHLFDTLSWNNLVVSSSHAMKIGQDFERYLGGVKADIGLIQSQTHRISRSVESLPVDVRESKETLGRIENLLFNIGNSVVGNPGGNDGGSSTNNDTIEGLLRDHLIKNSYGQSNNLSNIQSNTDTMQSLMGSQMRMFGEMMGMLDGISRNTDAIKNGSGGGSGGDGGDKPCTGPLCSFTKPSSSSGSALSKVFSNESIEDVKVLIENKDNEISAAMNDIKSVFAPEELTIAGTYNNDYHDINGVRVDLSGKSNLELFFNSGPKMAIWFLAVLIAFSILMGGRKNA